MHLFDLGERERRGGFVLEGEPGKASPACAGLGLDASGRVLFCEPEAHRLRIFSAFGHEEGSPVALAEGVVARDRRGLLVEPRRVLVGDGGGENLVLLLGGASWVHALQEFGRGGDFVRSYASLGRRGEPFRGACDLAGLGEELWVLERIPSRVQMFRRGGSYLGVLELGSFTASSPVSLGVYPEGFFVLFEGGDLRWIDRDLREKGRLRVDPGFERIAVEGAGIPWLLDPVREVLLRPSLGMGGGEAEQFELG